MTPTNNRELGPFRALILKHKEHDQPYTWELFANDESAWLFLEEKLKHWAMSGSIKEDYELVEVLVKPHPYEEAI